MPVPRLSAIFRYPVRSLRGQSLEQATIEPRGILGDRRWMVVDDTGRFLTRREFSRMALFDVRATPDGLLLSHPDHGTVHVGQPDAAAPLIHARVWKDIVPVRCADAQTGDFLTRAIGRPAQLVYQPDESRRAIDPAYADPDDETSLSDGYPLLVTALGSLAALNERLALPIGITRFRPNLVIDGVEPWAEDKWRLIRIGGATLRIVKPCSRCINTTQDELTGERFEGNDPLKTLRWMGRMTKGGIMFGQNAIPDGPGEVRVGDEIEIIEEGDSNLR